MDFGFVIINLKNVIFIFAAEEKRRRRLPRFSGNEAATDSPEFA